MKTKLTMKDIVILQLVVGIYTISSVVGKFASQQEGIGFLVLYAAEIGVLGIYAILWQQMIRRFELSVAYANRAAALVWSLIWSILIFKEQVTVKQLLGIALVIVGTAVINSGKEAQEDA